MGGRVRETKVHRPIIMMDTSKFPTFCDNKCENTECSKHISKWAHHIGGAKISKLRNTEKCEGCIPRRRNRRK